MPNILRRPLFLRLSVSLPILIPCLFGGCSPAPEFRLNGVEARKQELTVLKGEKFSREQLANLGDIMTATFGTPDAPTFPYEIFDDPDEAKELIDPERLRIAAGAVSSDRTGKQQGLYREHCAHCHGVTGDGLGPTAATLNPYPRDFRMGKYKFKSSKLGKSASREDIRRILVNGIPGTAMPSFRLLQNEDDVASESTQEKSVASDEKDDEGNELTAGETSKSKLEHDEIEALVDYVIYLSIRGQVERILLSEMTMIGEEEVLVDLSLANSEDEEDLDDFDGQLGLIFDVVMDETYVWLDELGAEPNIPKRPESLEPDHPEYQTMIQRGRELFLGSANCHSCHGNTALGDGQTDKYDAWTEDWLNVVGESDERMKEFRSLGALTPRKIRPRNLRHGVYRGGRRPVDVYLRIKNGIEGTPMPAASSGLSDEDVWAITEYVRQLPEEGEGAGTSVTEKPVNDRIVN